MKLTVLGCSGTFPGPQSGCSSYLVEHEGFRLLLDCGNGAVGALQRHTDLFGVDAIHVSHLHADHCVDLVAYAYARRYNPAGRLPLLPLFAPDGIHERMHGLVGHTGLAELVYDTTVTAPGRMEIGPFAVELALTNHPVPCHAIRLTAGGRSFVFSGDTGESDALVDLARDADVLLIEASICDDDTLPPGIHLSARQAGQHAARAGVGRTLLTHITPWGSRERALEQGSDAFSGPIELVSADVSYDI
jgi:ribonuclease BN (tRNA processing enzyme)